MPRTLGIRAGPSPTASGPLPAEAARRRALADLVLPLAPARCWFDEDEVAFAEAFFIHARKSKHTTVEGFFSGAANWISDAA